jgi:hypothetical protein
VPLFLPVAIHGLVILSLEVLYFTPPFVLANTTNIALGVGSSRSSVILLLSYYGINAAFRFCPQRYFFAYFFTSEVEVICCLVAVSKIRLIWNIPSMFVVCMLQILANYQAEGKTQKQLLVTINFCARLDF